MKVGELARRTGKTVRALRLYEEEGLLSPARRSSGGFRLYGADALVRVYWIAKLQDLGFSLAQIRGLLATVERSKRAPEAMESVRALFEGKLAATRAQIARLLELARDLEESLAYLEGCRTCTEEAAPAVCASCEAPHGNLAVPPPLVAGLVRRGAREPEESRKP